MYIVQQQSGKLVEDNQPCMPINHKFKKGVNCAYLLLSINYNYG